MRTFDNFSSFALHLGVIVAANEIKTHESLKVATEYLEKKIKDRFGNYLRTDEGAFEKWKELAPATKADRVRKGYTPNDPLLRSGELRDSIQSEVRGLEAVIGSDSDIMVWQELGTSRIPARSVLGAEAYMAKDKIAEFVAISTIDRIAGKNERTRI
jgi:phage gpG-like protein